MVTSNRLESTACQHCYQCQVRYKCLICVGCSMSACSSKLAVQSRFTDLAELVCLDRGLHTVVFARATYHFGPSRVRSLRIAACWCSIAQFARRNMQNASDYLLAPPNPVTQCLLDFSTFSLRKPFICSSGWCDRGWCPNWQVAADCCIPWQALPSQP